MSIRHIREDCKSIDNILSRDENTKDCLWYIKPKSKNTTGQQSVCYQVCCGLHPQGNCNYYLKQLNTTKPERFWNEVNQQKKFSDLNLAPKILDAFTCDGKYNIVMEKIDITLQDYLVSLASNDSVSFSDLMRKCEVMREETKSAVRFLNARKLYHGDLKLDNIGVLFTPGKIAEFKIQFIDFGVSGTYPDDLDDLNLSFDAIQKVIGKLKLCPRPAEHIEILKEEAVEKAVAEEDQSPVKISKVTTTRRKESPKKQRRGLFSRGRSDSPAPRSASPPLSYLQEESLW